MNFITNFVKQVLNQSQKESTEKELNEKMVFTKEFKKGKKSVKSQKFIIDVDFLEAEEEKLAKEEKKLKNDRISKELIGYLWNDTSLDISLKQMNELEKDLNQTKEAFTKVSHVKNEKKSKIDFKQEEHKSLKGIFIQFVVGLLLIGFTLSYVQTQPAEKKFLQSSVDLWANTFQKIIGKFGWVFTENVDKNYIEKRGQLVSELIDMEKKVQLCLDQTSDDKKRQELQKLLLKIQAFRQELSSTQYIPLENFIQNYDQYNLYVYSLQKTVDGLKCEK